MTPRKNSEGAASRRQRLHSSLPSGRPPGLCESFKPLSLPAAHAASVPIISSLLCELLYPLTVGMSMKCPLKSRPFHPHLPRRRPGAGRGGPGKLCPGFSSDLALHYAELFCAAVSIFVAFNRPSPFTFTDSVLYYSRSVIVGGSRAPARNGIERRENEC